MNSILRIIIVTALVSLFTGAIPAWAAIGPTPIPCPENLPCINQETQASGEAVRQYITDSFGVLFLQGFLGLVAASAVIFIIVGGVQMRMSFGNEETLKKAKNTIIWAVAGLVIALLSVAIVQIVTRIL